MEYKPSYASSLRADIQPSYNDSLQHHGILGQKWGIRRFQNKDGSLTKDGKARYNNGSKPNNKNNQKIKKSDFNTYSRIIQDKIMQDPDISKKYYKANDLSDEYGRTDPRTKQAYWKAAYSGGLKEADLLIKKYGRDYFDSQITYENGYPNRSYPKDSRENYAKEKAYRLSGINNNLTDRFRCAQADNPKLKTWNPIYKEMKADMSNEDPSYYREIEDAWLTKHGY